jgi:hypothetical protein
MDTQNTSEPPKMDKIGTQRSPSLSTRVNLSITEERLTFIDEYAAKKRWARSAVIAAIIDGFRTRLEQTAAPAADPDRCAIQGHVRGPKNSDETYPCQNCHCIKDDLGWRTP